MNSNNLPRIKRGEDRRSVTSEIAQYWKTKTPNSSKELLNDDDENKVYLKSSSHPLKKRKIDEDSGPNEGSSLSNSNNEHIEKLEKKLKGSQFRILNEKMYTTTGTESLQMIQDSPELFNIYHEGFRSQVEKWPENPVDIIVKFIKSRSPKIIVADFGCGDAKIAQSIKNKVHSFDLESVNEFVTKCDISNVPLEDNTIDVAVFSLSLMGTNYVDFLIEAHRVLKKNGILKIAEVKSRFSDIEKFIHFVKKRLGFEFVSKDDSNKMFFLLEFKKLDKKIPKGSVSSTEFPLKACQYKKR